MFVLNKKRICLILSVLVISTIAFQISGAKKLETQETVALPVNNKTIIIDAGHRSEKMVEQ